MLLKKQTVWLLTMLSLVVVLSVYYVTSDPAKNDLATGGKEEAAGEMEASEKDMKVITEAAGDEAFETIRMEIQDKRSKEIADLTNQVGSPDLTAEEKNELYTKMQDLSALETKEKTLESLIKSLGYDDALVRTENEEMLITVKAKEHSRADAARILQVVREEIGTNMVATVEFQKN
ncbi:MAG TPA: stage III sporulation protein AH [Bacillus bacterium]|uniref:Stage III sporulation protein AH n=1 Tax=Siminovitchia fordii TaxID=254759 RepID=A0ABQ4K2G8_9BACI|nr:SpoIIIAH-like family protein [Siminovitchia fordii]GIN19958.1 stage III sporulation protein AH [Siminovitchia fordii]HBZ08979.1 stage III sporulation protein AH [Bacillus sp. (in: firmicutes)]